MELTEGIFRAGDNYVVNEIEKDCAEMLVTKYGQSEIAFGGDVLKIGPPNFKCMFLPRLEAGMTVQYSELRGPAEHIVKWTNIGTTESSREFSRNISSVKHCMHCLLRVAANPAVGKPGEPAFSPVHGCTCSQPAAETDISTSD